MNMLLQQITQLNSYDNDAAQFEAVQGDFAK